MDKIILPKIEVMTCHGVYDTERITPQPFEIMIALQLDLYPAGISDDVEDTVDYGELYVRAKRLAENETYSLIETLAAHLATLALSYDRVEQVTVRVKKCEARTGDNVFPAIVEIMRNRL